MNMIKKDIVSHVISIVRNATGQLSVKPFDTFIKYSFIFFLSISFGFRCYPFNLKSTIYFLSYMTENWVDCLPGFLIFLVYSCNLPFKSSFLVCLTTEFSWLLAPTPYFLILPLCNIYKMISRYFGSTVKPTSTSGEKIHKIIQDRKPPVNNSVLYIEYPAAVVIKHILLR